MSEWISKDTLIYRTAAGEEYFTIGRNIASTIADSYLVIRENLQFYYMLDSDCDRIPDKTAGDLLCEIIEGPSDGMRIQIHKADVELEWVSGPGYIANYLTLRQRPIGQGVEIK